MSAIGLKNPRNDWDKATHHSVYLIRTGTQPKFSVRDLRARKAVTRTPGLQRTLSGIEPRTHAAPVVSGQPKFRERSFTRDHLPAEVLPYKRTFQDGRAGQALIVPKADPRTSGQAGVHGVLYRYHTESGDKVGRFYTTEKYTSASEAARALGMPSKPTHVTVLSATGNIVAYEGRAAAAFGNRGGGPQIFVRRADTKRLKIESTEKLAQ